MSSFFITSYQSTKLDGGRDGLGLLPIWSREARRVIWNITSISSDLGGWRTLLLCARLAEIAVGTKDPRAYGAAMLAAERLVGLARGYAPTESLRNLHAVRGSNRLISLEGETVRVSGEKGIKILSGQKATGVLGQIGRPAIRSGLLREGLILTDETRVGLEEFFPAISEGIKKQLRDWLLESHDVDLANPPGLFDELARAAGPRPTSQHEAAWLREWVLCCAHGDEPSEDWNIDAQRTLVDALEKLKGPEKESQNTSLRDLHSLLKPHLPEDDKGVARWLEDIANLEALLGRMEALFAWMRFMVREPKPRKELKVALDEQWLTDQSRGPVPQSFDRALQILSDRPNPDRECFKAFANALHEGNSEQMIESVLRRQIDIS